MPYASIVKFLLDCDPGVKLQKLEGKSLLHFAYLRDFNDSNIEAGMQVIGAIYDSHPEAIYDNNISPHIHDNCHEEVQAFHQSELVYARQARDRHLMTSPDENGRLPLHHALRDKVRPGSLELLVKAYPDAIRRADSNGALPLHMACQYHDSPSIVQHMIDLDLATAHHVDAENNTALHYACHGAKYETIALLLDRYASLVSECNNQKKLPIVLLIESDAVEDRESVKYIDTIFRLLKACP